MLTKKQIFDIARCREFGMVCFDEQSKRRCSLKGIGFCMERAAITALAYREMLERLFAKAESMYSYIEESEAGYDPGTYDPDELGEIEELLEKVEALLKESEVEEG